MAKNQITVASFDRASLQGALVRASGATNAVVPRQVDYLAQYAGMLGTRTVVVEEHYVDRHYVEEYASYYSRMLEPPSNAVQRFHLFSRAFGGAELEEMFTSSASSDDRAQEVRDRLRDVYLGFISVRPLPSVPIGRTVLRRLADNLPVRREIWATCGHDVHLANLRLRVEGLAFQQQDQAVGACATAALWSALSRVARHDGMRAPTPAEVTAFASRHLLPYGRNMPASGGLTMQQLSEAVRGCGFAPEVVRADTKPEIFVLALHTYLLSGLPVVLELLGHGGGHAVTAVGFEDGGSPHPLLQTTFPVRSACVKKIYVHDDRIGPYAKAFVSPVTHPDFGDRLLLQIEHETWLLNSGLIPVYPKLRLSVGSFVHLADRLTDLIETAVGSARATQLAVDFYYKRSGDYLSGLRGGWSAGTLVSFLGEVVLSRWCGIVRWHLGDALLAEFVYDTTDIVRPHGEPDGHLLRAIVCHDTSFRGTFQALAAYFGAPFLG
jgi:hypothetical protein